MIRRPATYNPGSSSSAGFVLAWMLRIDALGNETLVMAWENGTGGTVSEVPSTSITFTDGAPATIPTLE